MFLEGPQQTAPQVVITNVRKPDVTAATPQPQPSLSRDKLRQARTEKVLEVEARQAHEDAVASGETG